MSLSQNFGLSISVGFQKRLVNECKTVLQVGDTHQFRRALEGVQQCSQLLLSGFASGDILGDPGNPINLPLIIAYRKGAVLNPADRTIRVNDAIGFVVLAGSLLGERGFEHAPAILEM